MLGTKSQRKGPVSLVSIAVNSSSKQLVNSKKNNYRSATKTPTDQCLPTLLWNPKRKSQALGGKPKLKV